jgi:hypothetical protein
VAPRRGLDGCSAPSDDSGERRRARLASVLGAFDGLLSLRDRGAVKVGLASVVANYADGDPVWQLLVSPPGCGKSEIVSSTIGAPSVWGLSSLTPQTLLSGFERDDDRPASLLLQIGRFGILAFKDLTTVLTMHREARAAIMAQLREVADGRTEKSFGNGLRVSWEGKLGLLAGVTPVIDRHQNFLALMGERFLLHRMAPLDRRAAAARSLARRGREGELRKRIQTTVTAFLEPFVECGPLHLPRSFNEPLVALADIVTHARSGVARDGYSRELLYLPQPEAPTRLAKQIAQIGAGLLAIGVDKGETWRQMRKLGWDSVPSVRCSVLHSLAGHTDPITHTSIQEHTGLPAKTEERAVDDLVALGLAVRTSDNKGRWLIGLSEVARGYWAHEPTPPFSSAARRRRHHRSRRQRAHRPRKAAD